MKIAPFLAVLSVGALLAACNSLDSPFHGLLNTGHDARVYNTTTGQYEWPADTPRPKPKISAADIAAAAKETPKPAASPAKGDGRYFDVTKGNFVKDDSDPQQPAPKKLKATPRAVAAQTAPAPQASETAQATPTAIAVAPRITPVPVPAKGSGIYNPQTHQFEYGPTAGAKPAVKSTPNPQADSSRTPAGPLLSQ